MSTDFRDIVNDVIRDVVDWENTDDPYDEVNVMFGIEPTEEGVDHLIDKYVVIADRIGLANRDYQTAMTLIDNVNPAW